MKELLIIRKWRAGEGGSDGTFGTAFAYDGESCAHTWDSGELPWVDQDRDGKRDANISCIRRGHYLAQKRLSPRRGIDVYQLEGVPNAHSVQIHSGNFCGDKSKGKVSHVEGCILLGKGQGPLRTREGFDQQAVTNSKAAIREFMDWAGGEDIRVKIEEQFPGVGEATPAGPGAS